MSEMPYNAYAAPAKSSAFALGTATKRNLEDDPALAELARAREEHAHDANDAALARLERLLQPQPTPSGSQAGPALSSERSIACAWSLYGRVLGSLGREQDAAEAFGRAVEIFDRILVSDSPESGEVYSDFGRALFRVGQSDRAVAELKRALALDYYSHDTLKYLGLALAETGSPESVGYLEQALTMRPGDDETRIALAVLRREPRGFLELGEYHWSRSDFDAAIAAFNEAIALGGDDADVLAEARTRLGTVLLATNRAAEAIEPLQDAARNETWAFRGHEYLAEAQRLLGRYDDALASIDRALELGEDAYALGTKGQVLAALGRSGEAIEWLIRAVELQPGAEWLLVELVPLLEQAGRPDEALDHLRRLVEATGSAWGSIQVAAHLVQLGRPDEAVAALKAATVRWPGNENICRDLVSLLRGAGRYEEAAQQVEILVKANPTSAWGFTDLGESLRLLQRYDDALRALDTALELEPGDGYALGTKGQVLRAKNDLPQARDYLERAIQADRTLGWVKEELMLLVEQSESDAQVIALIDRMMAEDPSWQRGHAWRGATLRRMGRLDEARSSLEEAVRLDPDDTFALQELGECLRISDHSDEALTVFDRVLALDPENAFVLASKAAILVESGDADGAITLARRAHEINANNTFAIMMEAMALRALNREEEALALLHDGLALHPDDVGLLAQLGETLRFLERDEEAVAVLVNALTLEPNNAECLATRGLALRALGRYDESLSDLRRAVELDPTYAWAHGGLGQVLVEIGEFADALDHSETAVKLDPSFGWYHGVQAYARELLEDAAGARDAARAAHEAAPDEVTWVRCLADNLLATGDREGAQALYRKIIDGDAGSADPDTLAHVAWSYRFLGEHDAAAQTYQRALARGGRHLEYMRLDFALALLCGGREELAFSEYERALLEVAKQAPARALGLLYVARHDLERGAAAAGVGERSGSARKLLDDALALNRHRLSAAEVETRTSVLAQA